ncbi:MAG TPA: ABC transporter permease [Vicinamibacteria bacterium]|nr:ABC transporter permease [Vicinamibacteria bacterium]
MIKLTFRTLWKNPGFTVVSALTLAIGIGANTAIFSVVHTVLLQPLPFEEPSRIVSLWEYSPDDAGRMHRSRATAANYFDWKAESQAFENMALYGSAGLNWTGDGEPEQLLGGRVSASYFSVLGIEPVLGRTFLPEESRIGNHRVLILSHGLWQNRFGGARDVIGRVLNLDDAPYQIIGVMPPGVYPTWPQATGRTPFLPLYQQFWVPMALSEERAADRGSHLYGVLARLKADVTLEAARAEMTTIARRLEDAYPGSNAGEAILVVSYMDEVVGGARVVLWTLLAAVGLVLLAACANIAGLNLARSAARQREVALRSALGAGRSVMIRQLLTESMLVGLLGGAIGTALAIVGINALIRLSPTEIPRLAESGLTTPVLAFTLGLSLLTGFLSGLVPALKSSRPDLQTSLRESARSTTERFGMRSSLVVCEVALAVILVVAAGLLVQSFRRLREVDLGFVGKNVLLAELTLPPTRYDDWQAVSRFHREVLERLRRLPAVSEAALAYDHPLESNWIDSFRIVGGSQMEESFAATLRIVSPGYFRALGIELRQGREFAEIDDAEHPGAVIVNEAFVRRYFEGSRAIGRSLYSSTPSFVGNDLPDTFEIVGVVENVRFLGPRSEPEPAFYLSAAQFPVTEMLLAIRTETDPLGLAAGIRGEIWAIDPNLPVSNVTTMERYVAEALAQPRFTATVLSFFGVAALALAGLGLYGVLAFTVARRTSEIGIRMALGARANDVIAMVVGQGLRLTTVGLILGLAGALVTSRVLSGLLFGVRGTDVTTFGAAVVFLGLVAAGASYVPARRAARVEPLRALRYD